MLHEPKGGDRKGGEHFQERDASQEAGSPNKGGGGKEEPCDGKQVEHGFETLAPVNRERSRERGDHHESKHGTRDPGLPHAACERALRKCKRNGKKRRETESAKCELPPRGPGTPHPGRETNRRDQCT